MEFPRQEYWSGLPFPSPGDLPKPGTEPRSPALQADALLSEPPGKSKEEIREQKFLPDQYCFKLKSCLKLILSCGLFLPHLLFPSPKGNTYILILAGRSICTSWRHVQFVLRPHILQVGVLDQISYGSTPALPTGSTCGSWETHSLIKKFLGEQADSIAQFLPSEQMNNPSLTFCILQVKSDAMNTRHSATLGAVYETERQGADTHIPLPFIRGWSFTTCRSSPQNLLLGLYYVNLQILTLKIVQMKGLIVLKFSDTSFENCNLI